MDFWKAVGWAKGHRTGVSVASLILVFAGLDLLLNPPKDRPADQWFSIPLFATGFSLFALVLWPTERPGPRPARDTLARRFLDWASWRGRLVPFFPLFGAALVLAVLAYNRFVSPTPALLENDVVTLLFAGVLIVYRFVPGRFDRERDFVLLFTGALAIILVGPLLVMRSLGVDAATSVNAYSAVALAPQTGAILGAIGVPNTVFAGPAGAPALLFTTSSGQDVVVYITTQCSGVYSFSIFGSAFSAFVLTEQRKLTVRIGLFFALGIFFAYLANVLRMVVIILVGFHFSSGGGSEAAIQAMLVTHSNAGWIIFLAWVSVFWFILFRLLPPVAREAPPPGAPVAARRGTFCGICGIVLTPAIPATQCQCERLYHIECLTSEGACPNCSTPFPPAAVQGQPATGVPGAEPSPARSP